jgi:hypothetical protein
MHMSEIYLLAEVEDLENSTCSWDLEHWSIEDDDIYR